MKNNYKKYNISLRASGFTLVEVMTAMTILSIGLVGSLTVINSNLRNISFEDNRIFAASLAEDGMERVRNVRDTNWLKGNAWDKDIDGNSNDEQFVKFNCVSGSMSKLIGANKIFGGTENELINDCADGADGIFCYVLINSKAGSPDCYGDNAAPGGGYASAQYPGFYRLIHIEALPPPLNGKAIKVNVTVRWTESGQNKYLTAEETLYDWQP